MGLIFKDSLSDVGRYKGSYGNQKAYSVKSNKDDAMVKVYCEKTGSNKLTDDEFRQVLEKIKRDPSIVKQYNLASTGGFPVVENGTGRPLYIYFSKRSSMLGGTKYFAIPTHARKENK